MRWLDVLDDGRPILRLDERRYAYVDVEDAYLLVLSAQWDGDRPLIALNDGSTEPLACDTLVVGDDDALYCRVREGKLEARITTPAYYALSERIVENPGDPGGGFALRALGRLFPIGKRQHQAKPRTAQR